MEPHAEDRAEARYPWMKQWWFLLLAMLFVFEVITPFLQWPLGLPKAVILATEGTAALIVFFTFAIMLTEDRIPKGILVILGITLVWGLVAFFEGQPLATFLWGWWRFFAFPLVGVFTYLVIGNPKGFAEWFIKFCLGLLAFQVLVQLIMLGLGYPMGDNMAGTLGWHGVMQFTMMTFFVVSIGLGHWIASNQLKYMLIAVSLSAIGSVLSATKFYFFILPVMLGVTFAISMIQGGRIRTFIISIIVLLTGVSVLVPIFNSQLLENSNIGLQDYLDPDIALNYLMYANVNTSGRSYVGRGYAPVYAWQQLQRDTTTILFGHGLGSRTSSSQLGLSGVGFQNDIFGVNGTALSTWMFEYGIIGLFVFLLILAWITMRLFQYLKTNPEPYKASIAYGLILFTAFWPVWIWYHNVWSGEVMKALYWISLGYILRQAFAPPPRPASSRVRLPHENR